MVGCGGKERGDGREKKRRKTNNRVEPKARNCMHGRAEWCAPEGDEGKRECLGKIWSRCV